MYHDRESTSHHHSARSTQVPITHSNSCSNIPIPSGHDVSLNDDEVVRYDSPATHREDWACSPVNGLESINDSSHSYPTQLRKTGPVRRELPLNFDQPPLPSRVIGLSLLEVYFTRIYNASLLFYKPFLFQNYLNGKLPDILLKAIFALSTLYAPSCSSIFLIVG